MSSLYSSASELRRSFCVLPTAERRNVLAANGTPEWNTMQANRNGKKEERKRSVDFWNGATVCVCVCECGMK